MPWLRLDALALNIVWVMPTFTRTMPRNVGTAWKLAGCFVPISFSWAAGDVSLAAYIQSTLTAMNIKSKDVSPLGAVMAFLFSSYVVLNASECCPAPHLGVQANLLFFSVLSSTLGKVIDRDFVANGNIYKSLQQGSSAASAFALHSLTYTFPFASRRYSVHCGFGHHSTLDSHPHRRFRLQPQGHLAFGADGEAGAGGARLRQGGGAQQAGFERRLAQGAGLNVGGPEGGGREWIAGSFVSELLHAFRFVLLPSFLWDYVRITW